MGYTTDFTGAAAITPTLKPEHRMYLQAFADIRHMPLDKAKAALIADPLREAVGLPVGNAGCYVIGYPRWPFNKWDRELAAPKGALWQGGGWGNSEHLATVAVAFNGGFSSTTPGLWCQWTVDDDGMHLSWDGGEKFYEYTEWLRWLIDNFFQPWGYTLNGEIYWSGEDSGDLGLIDVTDNKVTTHVGTITYG